MRREKSAIALELKPEPGVRTIRGGTEFTMMNREQLLAAEIFGYSYASYHDHLGANIRFDELMPRSVATAEQAERESWPIEKLAGELEVEVDHAREMLDALPHAREVVDAENPAESFRNGVRQSILTALEAGLNDPDSVEHLVTQICYRAADLAYLLELDGDRLTRYSHELRRDPDTEDDVDDSDENG